jgi:hypothetical protein
MHGAGSVTVTVCPFGKRTSVDSVPRSSLSLHHARRQPGGLDAQTVGQGALGDELVPGQVNAHGDRLGLGCLAHAGTRRRR